MKMKRKRKKQYKKSLTWDDTDNIARKLLNKYPDIAPFIQSEEDIREKVIDLEGFKDAPQPKRDIYLFDIRRKWIILSDGGHEDPKEEVYLSDICP